MQVFFHTFICRLFLIIIATLLNTTVSVMAEVLPNGETVDSGVISISQNEQSMIINQSSNHAIIEWNSFDIGQNNSVVFQQPSISSSALNRVMSGNPTNLAGTLGANGNVFVVNENGVYFTSTAIISANSLSICILFSLSSAEIALCFYILLSSQYLKFISLADSTCTTNSLSGHLGIPAFLPFSIYLSSK